MSTNHSADYDVIAVGAGFAGISLSYHLREAGFNVKVFDRADEVGGTWAWNKYPGAATDSESYYYCLTFSKEVLQEWSWSKRYSGWEETQAYLKFVMDKFSLWSMFQMSTEVKSATFDNDTGLWNVQTGDGKTHTAKYFVSAMGMISQPVIPTFSGIDRFAGPIFHSSRWPDGLDVAGKRVGIIGAGATTVQMLPEVAKTASQVTVFQRTPNFVLPAMQKDMTPEWEKEIKDNYDEIIAKARNHMFGMAFEQPPGRNAVDTPPEEVQRIFEEHWKGSFRWVFETFDDLLGSAEANQMASDFITSKIKEKVNDPELVELLTPKGYPLFAKRPPLDHGYYEAYNRDNVKLVDIKDREPIQEITETGIQTTENLYEFDIIVLATGFQAYTGALEAIDIRGADGHTLREKWQDESKSIMGVYASGYPNFFMITGPQAPFANLPTSIEQNVAYITDCITKMETEGYDRFEPSQQAEDEWSEHTAEIHNQTLMAQGDKVNSWMMGANLEKRKPRVLVYFGGAHIYYDKLRESAESGFPELSFNKSAA